MLHLPGRIGTESTGTERRREEEQRGRTPRKAYLEVLVQEVEEQQDGHQEGQCKGRCHADQNDGGRQLQAASQEECSKVGEVLVHVRCVFGETVDDSAGRSDMKEGERGPAQQYGHC